MRWLDCWVGGGALLTRAMTRIAERDGRRQPGQCQVGSDVTLHLSALTSHLAELALIANIASLSRTDNPHSIWANRKKNNFAGSQTGNPSKSKLAGKYLLGLKYISEANACSIILLGLKVTPGRFLKSNPSNGANHCTG